MADYYTQFSFMTPAHTPEEKAFLLNWDKCPPEADDDEWYEEHYGVEAKDDGDDGIWVSPDDHGSVDNAVQMVADWQTKFGKDDFVEFEWSDACSKPRLDAFGGSGVLIHKGKAHWAPKAHTWCAEKKKELQGTLEDSGE